MCDNTEHRFRFNSIDKVQGSPLRIYPCLRQRVFCNKKRKIYALDKTVLLVLSRLRTKLGLNRILNHQICIVIHAFELQVELQLRFVWLQVRLQQEIIHLNR
jgi:hypothetical protein